MAVPVEFTEETETTRFTVPITTGTTIKFSPVKVDKTTSVLLSGDQTRRRSQEVLSSLVTGDMAQKITHTMKRCSMVTKDSRRRNGETMISSNSAISRTLSIADRSSLLEMVMI